MESHNYTLEKISKTKYVETIQQLQTPEIDNIPHLNILSEILVNTSDENGNFYYIIIEISCSVICGVICLHGFNHLDKSIEFGIFIHHSFWRMGILKSIFPIISALAVKQIEVKKFNIAIHQNNLSAQTAAESLGFILLTKTAKNNPDDRFYYHVYEKLL